MIINITFIIAILVAINFLLLKLSCNKTPKKNKINRAPVVLNTKIDHKEHLAPTGS